MKSGSGRLRTVPVPSFHAPGTCGTDSYPIDTTLCTEKPALGRRGSFANLIRTDPVRRSGCGDGARSAISVTAPHLDSRFRTLKSTAPHGPPDPAPMPQRLWIEFDDLIDRIMKRRNSRQNAVLDDDDRRGLLDDSRADRDALRVRDSLFSLVGEPRSSRGGDDQADAGWMGSRVSGRLRWKDGREEPDLTRSQRLVDRSVALVSSRDRSRGCACGWCCRP